MNLKSEMKINSPEYTVCGEDGSVSCIPFRFQACAGCRIISRRQKLGINNREFNKGSFRACSVGALPDWGGGRRVEGKGQWQSVMAGRGSSIAYPWA